MCKQAVISIFVMFVVAAPAHATIRENYPDLDMAFVGDHVVHGLVGATLAQPFALRLTDAAGNPLPGLTVYFSPNYLRGPDTSLLPPLSAYGSFGGIRELTVITDNNGIARTPDFQIGQFPEEVVAGIYGSTPENLAVIQGGWGYALFHVNGAHHGPADPQAPDGEIVSTPLPVDSFHGLALLVGGLLFAARLALRRTSTGWRR